MVRVMKIKKYLNFIINRVNNYHKRATNPFINPELSHNPFTSAFNTTYVWIEEKNHSDERK